MAKPRTPTFPYVELEFPPLAQLNKLGDGSLRSSLAVDEANIQFVGKLVKAIAPSMWNPFTSIKHITIVTSSSATNSFRTKIVKTIVQQHKGSVTVLDSTTLSSSSSSSSEVYIFISPSSRGDYSLAEQVAKQAPHATTQAVIVVNGFAKAPNSVSGLATMAYYYKPLTYNSQLAGYLIRSYPSLWTVLDATTSDVLQTYTDPDILVPNTNTPDLRSSGKLVQQSVDARAIAARRT